MTYEEIRARMAAEYEAQAGFAPDDASDAGIRIRVLAGEIYTALRMLEVVKDEAFPQTASGEALELHAMERGLSRKPAVRAQGTLTFSRETALTYDVEIPQGTACAASAGAAEFETTEAAVLAAGALSVTVPAQAVAGGKAFNAAAGAVDTLVTPPAGIEGVTNGAAFSGRRGCGKRRRAARASAAKLEHPAERHERRDVPPGGAAGAGVGSVNVVPRASGPARSPSICTATARPRRKKRSAPCRMFWRRCAKSTCR